MLLVHYNDLKADLAGEIARIAHFLEIEPADGVMQAIVEAARFETMKQQGPALMPGSENTWVEGSQTFINKGVNGRWQGACAEADIAAYETKLSAEFTPALAAWLENGRRVAGDPALSPD
jgi:aryl sulfotransferase